VRSYRGSLDGDEHRRSESLPRREGFARHHGVSGTDLSRIISLSDGVFAFALTLLALSLAVPVVSSKIPPDRVSSNLAFLLQHDYNAFLGYAFAFIMIGVWWVVHQRTFNYIARYNSTLIWFNMAILLQIAVMPFVLSVFTNYGDTQTAVGLFAFIQVSLGITTASLWDYARRAELIQPNVPEPIAIYFSRRGWYTSAIFAISIGITFVSVTAAELSWIAVFVVQRLLDRPGVETPL